MAALIARLELAHCERRRCAGARERESDSETYYQMEQTLSSQNKRLDSQGRRIDELERQLSRALDEIGDMRRGVAQLIDQLEGAGLKPVWTPPRKLANGNTTTGLRNAIKEKYNLDEMQDLALDLGVPPHAIGATTPAGYARELTTWAERHGILEELERLITKQRPE